jgi:hypothetical protein
VFLLSNSIGVGVGGKLTVLGIRLFLVESAWRMNIGESINLLMDIG